MHPNAQLIHDFYMAFAERDAAGMARCYHPEIRFSDPAFPDLRGADVNAMWAMLCHRGTDLHIEFAEITADDFRGCARWEATYTFSKTGRSVHNIIHAQFAFKDGLILDHVDEFNFARWAEQALGMIGHVFGKTQWLQRKVQAQAAEGLADFKRGAA